MYGTSGKLGNRRGSSGNTPEHTVPSETPEWSYSPVSSVRKNAIAFYPNYAGR